MEHTQGTGTKLSPRGQIFSHNSQTSLGPPAKQSIGHNKFTQPHLREADAENTVETEEGRSPWPFYLCLLKTYVNYIQRVLYLKIKIL